MRRKHIASLIPLSLLLRMDDYAKTRPIITKVLQINDDVLNHCSDPSMENSIYYARLCAASFNADEKIGLKIYNEFLGKSSLLDLLYSNASLDDQILASEVIYR